MSQRRLTTRTRFFILTHKNTLDFIESSSCIAYLDAIGGAVTPLCYNNYNATWALLN